MDGAARVDPPITAKSRAINCGRGDAANSSPGERPSGSIDVDKGARRRLATQRR